MTEKKKKLEGWEASSNFDFRQFRNFVVLASFRLAISVVINYRCEKGTLTELTSHYQTYKPIKLENR